MQQALAAHALGQRLAHLAHRAPHRPRQIVKGLQRQRLSIDRVATEQFVGAFAGQHHLHVLTGFARDEEQRDQRRVGNRLVEVPDDLGQRGDELVGLDHLGDVPGADRLGGGHRDVDLGESLPLETGGEGDQPGVVPDGQGRDRRGVDAAGQKRPDGDVGAHVLGHRVLEDRGDLVVAGLLGVAGDRHRGEPRREVAGGFRWLPGPDSGVAARFEPAHPAVQRLGLRDVLQHGVVLDRSGVDRGVEADQFGQIQQALLLTGHRGSAGAGRHEQRLDAERVSGADQFASHGVPEREGEHAAQPGQHVDAPVVVSGDDGLTVTVGGEDGAVLGG